MGYFPDPKPPKREKKKRKPLNRKRKVTGEKNLFLEILNERPHVSQVSGVPLGKIEISCFAHILSKGAFPKFRLNKENIWLMLPEEHYDYDFGSTDDPKWDKVKLKKEELKREYNNKDAGHDHSRSGAETFKK